MSSEPLVFMPIEGWNELKEVFKSDWPRSITGYTVLETQEHILYSDLDYGFEVYCPYGNVNNGMVALNDKNTFYEVIIQCPNDNTNKLEEALKQTKLINWRLNVHVSYAPKHVMDCIRTLIQERNYEINRIVMTTTFLLDKDRSLFYIGLEPELSFRLLPLEYAPTVNNNWPHKYSGSDWYFELLIKANLGYGLFKGDELVAWVFVKEMGALGHLYTIEKHRRKGYGELTLKLISNLLLKDKKNVVTFCVAGNISAYNLFEKLGFKEIGDVERCVFSGF